MDVEKLREDYENRFEVLRQTAKLIDEDLRDLLKNLPRIDSISVRPKSIDRFVEKAVRKKYSRPLDEIQDQIGARVVVFYLEDVTEISKRILAQFRVIENRTVEEEDPTSFSYRAKHFVSLIPREITTKTNVPIDFFELQVSTLFQHAWSEANHDLVYKTNSPKNYDELKLVALGAAHAWGADRIFAELWELSKSQSDNNPSGE
jgi:putative GTP pyrophosphokinase